MKFKIGDRVGLIDDRYFNRPSNPWYSKSKVVGTVKNHTEGFKDWISIEWDNGQENNYSFNDLFMVDDLIMNVNELFEDIDI